MRNILHWLKTTGQTLWQWLREWSGDASYEQYCRRAAERGGAKAPIPSAEEFYLDSIDRRFSRPSRCC